MYGKTHTIETRELLRKQKKKYVEGVGIYDLNNNLIKSFDYARDIADYLNISKKTVSRYINKGRIYKNCYLLKINPVVRY